VEPVYGGYQVIGLPRLAGDRSLGGFNTVVDRSLVRGVDPHLNVALVEEGKHRHLGVREGLRAELSALLPTGSCEIAHRVLRVRPRNERIPTRGFN
jgi:hypothetical protein